MEEGHLGDHLYSKARASPNFEGVGRGSVAEVVAFVPMTTMIRDVAAEASPSSDCFILSATCLA